jgi:hypothetical protein
MSANKNIPFRRLHLAPCLLSGDRQQQVAPLSRRQNIECTLPSSPNSRQDPDIPKDPSFAYSLLVTIAACVALVFHYLLSKA